ncbi:hypothetical protein BH10ACT11_BH10ACT11_19540 [soil metagenome]
MPRATLYSIPGSHSAMTVQRMLELKGISYKRIDLLPVVSRLVTKVMRFPEVTIPALRIDDRRLSGSLEISRALDEIEPNPPLFPTETTARVAVEDAEHWGNEVLQDAVRRILWNAIRRDRKPLGSYAKGARIGIPIGLAVKTAAPIIAAEVRINGAEDPAVQADLAAFPAWLRRVDDWIEDGTLGGDPPNAADLQVATGLRLAMTLEDLRPFIEGRPSGDLAKRLVPDFPGHTPAILPAAWLEPLRAGDEPA